MCLHDDVRLRLLGLDVRGEVRLAAVNGGLHLLHRRAALSDVALRLPRELDLVLLTSRGRVCRSDALVTIEEAGRGVGDRA